MIKIENLSEEGLMNIIMNVSDVIDSHYCNSSCECGMQLEHTWITPEACYWLYKLLSIDRTGILVRPWVLERLKNGTNHPETL